MRRIRHRSYVPSKMLGLWCVLLGAALAVGAAAVLSSVQAQFVDMSEMFPCEWEGVRGLTDEQQEELSRCFLARELIINNCTLCHSFVPIVLQQFDEAAWKGLLDRHRPRVGHLGDEEIETMHWFLAKTYNPDNPPPPVPPELLDDWTSY